jgi:hypothetical protein
MTKKATPVDDAIGFDRQIAELEQTIADLKHRHADMQLAERERVVLVRDRNELKQKIRNVPEAQPELELIRSRLTELDMILESRHLNEWKLVVEPFWHAVRFGGLGIAIGWFLCAWGR